MNSKILSASTITGQTVYNLEGKNIGNIHELMIDPKEGRVVYAVLSFGGFLGICDKYFAVPVEALLFSDDDTINLDVSKEKLENAPSFDKDNWPLTANPEFVGSVYHHYGFEQHHYDAPA